MLGKNYSADTYSNIQQKRKKATKLFTTWLLIASISVSTLFGFSVGYLSQQFNNYKYMGSVPVFQEVQENQENFISLASNVVQNGGTMTVAETSAIVKQTVVEITTETARNNGRMGQLISTGAGSGVIVSENGYIATNYHVISGAKSITVRLSDGTEHTAAVKGTDAKTDLAVIKIEKTGLTPAVIGNSSKLAVGDFALAVGNPLGELGGTVTWGIISALDREIVIDGETMSLLQTDAAINPGNSGGGLFNLSGELIGIVNAKSSGSDIEGLGFAIPANTAKAVIDDLISGGYVRGRIDTGLTLTNISNAQTAMRNRASQLGLYITKSNNSQLKAGDRITAINGTAVTDLTSFNAIINGFKVGDAVLITVERNRRSITVSITLGELKL